MDSLDDFFALHERRVRVQAELRCQHALARQAEARQVRLQQAVDLDLDRQPFAFGRVVRNLSAQEGDE